MQCNKEACCTKHKIRCSFFPRKFLLIFFLLCSLVKRYQFIMHAYCFINHHYHLLMPPKKREKPIQRHETIKWSLYSNDSTKDTKESVIFCQADTNYTAHLKYGYSLKEIAEYLMVYYNTMSRVFKKLNERRTGREADIERE